MKILTVVGSSLALTVCASAQLTDLQPGRNFPASAQAFGTGGRSENIDVADIDNDGDYDAGVANGGDGAADINRLFINQGGSSGGTLGAFLEETSTRFAGLPADTSRDIEFVDFENDGDFDVFITNRGTNLNGGEVSRTYENQGGRQNGTIGFFSESTDDFWGTLISVPMSDEDGVQDGQGPYRNYACDCDFADLNDDGHIDLFASSYGPNINGARESRIFLNDGDGRFDEQWPWLEAGGDAFNHSLDTELVDLDADFDIDVFVSSRDSQARVFRNNIVEASATTALFTDVTQTALFDTGSSLNGSNNYECEYADVDGDGDFDVWMVNYDGGGGGNYDRILRNDGDLEFTKMPTWIQGDPDQNENETDFIDYDSDGDLDAFASNPVGTNRLYVSSLAQGVPLDSGIYHRSGIAGLANFDELPNAGNGFLSLDADVADVDGDGDPDILMSNDALQANRYFENALGVPDTFAPTFQQITDQADNPSGAEVVIHAAVRDNASSYIVAMYDADLIYTVDGGQERCVRMTSQGGMQFRGVIPGSLSGEIAYRVEVADDNGNLGVSATTAYQQSGSTPSGWQSLSCGTGGVNGSPYLEGFGDLSPGSTTRFVLRDAAPEAMAFLFLSLASTPSPFKQGTLYTVPVVAMINRPTDAGGLDTLTVPWPSLALLPSGTAIYTQFGIQDLSLSSGVSLSNALLATVP